MVEKEKKSRPIGIILLVILHLIEGIYGVVIGVLVVQKMGGLPIIVFSITLSVAYVLISYGLWCFINWARNMAIIFALFALTKGIVGLIGGDLWMVFWIALYGVIIWYLLRPQTKIMFNVKVLSGKLETLRTVMTNILVSVAIGIVVYPTISEDIIASLGGALGNVLRSVGGGIVFTAFPEMFRPKIIVSLATGVIFAMPYLLTKVSRFVANRFCSASKKWFISLSVAATVSFFLGIALGWQVFLPLILKIATHYWEGLPSVRSYLLASLGIVFATGILPQIPLFFFAFRAANRKGVPQNLDVKNEVRRL